MTRDLKPKKPAARSRGSTLLGIFIGLILGLVVALGVAWYVTKMSSPFAGSRAKPVESAKSEPAPAEAANSASSVAKDEPAKPAKESSKALDRAMAKTDDKPRFDFYKILPEQAEPGADADKKAAVNKPVAKPAPTAPSASPDSPATAKSGSYVLQAGAFQSAAEADNLKARLAMLGVEATVQTTTVPDKGTLHRVRLGPYAKLDDLNRVRATLKQNGVETSLVKQSSAP